MDVIATTQEMVKVIAIATGRVSNVLEISLANKLRLSFALEGMVLWTLRLVPILYIKM